MSRWQRIHQTQLEAPGTLSPGNFTCKINSNWLHRHHELKVSQKTQNKELCTVSISHNRAVFTGDAGFRINLLGGGLFMHRLGVSPQNLNSISWETKLKDLPTSIRTRIYKWIWRAGRLFIEFPPRPSSGELPRHCEEGRCLLHLPSVWALASCSPSPLSEQH